VTLADLFDLGFNYKELKQLGYRFRMAVWYSPALYKTPI
jgi:hypothetical protein